MCLYVVTRFLICVYLDVFNKMFYFKLCKCRYRGKPILYSVSQDLKIVPYYLIAFQKKNYSNLQDTSGNTVYSHCKGQCLAIGSAKDHQDKQTNIYTQNSKIQGH